jgi:acetyl esterase/lipase
MRGFDPDGPYEVEHEDLVYGGPDECPLLARVYRPRDVAGPFAALIDVHGGAWTYFDRTVNAYYDRALAACGMVVVALDFRQAPVRYPTAVADIVAGIRFVKANADRLGVAPDTLGLIGGSSGGHLALVAALRPNAPEHATTAYAGQVEGSSVDATVSYVLALWPVADPHARYRHVLDHIAHPRPTRDRFFQPDRLREGHEAFFGDEATMARASVPRMLEAGEAERLPPLWVAHPELDENVTGAMSERLVTAYRQAGGDAELTIFRSVGHAFANLPGAQADDCIAHMRRFIAGRLEPTVR